MDYFNSGLIILRAQLKRAGIFCYLSVQVKWLSWSKEEYTNIPRGKNITILIG